MNYLARRLVVRCESDFGLSSFSILDPVHLEAYRVTLSLALIEIIQVTRSETHHTPLSLYNRIRDWQVYRVPCEG